MIESFFKITLSIILGGIIGFERELKGKPAGLITLTLVCLGATMIAILQGFIQPVGDVTRLSAQVISGVGFIGGGTIIHNKGNVQGLTTAALLWIKACLGLIIGYGMFKLAFFCFICIVGVLVIMKHVEEKFIYNRRKIRVIIKIDKKEEFFEVKKSILNLNYPLKISRYKWNNYDHGLIDCIFSIDNKSEISNIESELFKIIEIKEIYIPRDRYYKI